MPEDDLKDLQYDVNKYQKLAGITNTEGGKLLLDTFLDDILSTINGLANGYQRLTHVEMIAMCAGLAERLNVVRVLTNSTTNLELANQVLREALTDTE